MSDSPKKPPNSRDRYKTIRRVHPLGLRVLVQLEDDADVTDGGLFIPESAKDTMAESILAKVIEVASAVDDHTHEETNVSGIPLGATVLISKTVGTKIPWDDRIRIIDSRDVLGIVHEVSVS